MLGHEANISPGLRLITCFALELEHFACDHTTSMENEKIQFKGVARQCHIQEGCSGCLSTPLRLKIYSTANFTIFLVIKMLDNH